MESPKPNILMRISSAIVGSIENFFLWYGQCIARNPIKFILGTLIVTGLSSLGFLNLYIEQRPHKMWIPSTSQYVKTKEWQEKYFPDNQRYQMILYEADNILTPNMFQKMYSIMKTVENITIEGIDGPKNIKDMCVRIPALGQVDEKPKSFINSSNPMHYRELYCSFYDLILTECLQITILDMFKNDQEVIDNITQQEIIDAINTKNISATYAYPIDFKALIGGITYNSTGHIIAAKSAIHNWLMALNKSAFAIEQSFTDSGLDDRADPDLHNWEGAFISTLLNISKIPSDLNLYIMSQRSFGEISSSTIMNDVSYLVMGMVLFFAYVQTMMGKFNRVEGRQILALIGIMSTFMATAVSFGLCSALGIMYSPVHSIIPLLMLGLGVDDMFVVVQSWNNLKDEDKKHPIYKRMGITLSYAGVAITVTSITDFAAFGIGANSVLPALSSFCIYSAVGIIVLYLFQTTYFVSWFTLDQRRLEGKRNSLFWCIKHPNWTANKCSQIDFCQTFFEKFYAPFILKPVNKVLVLLLTSALLGAAIWGLTTLRQDFNPIWFIPPSSYFFHFLTKIGYYYPGMGERGSIYIGNIDYPKEVHKIGNLTSQMWDSPYITKVNSWYDDLADFVMENEKYDIRGKELIPELFYGELGKFLYSQAGAKYQSYFSFENNTMASCTESANKIVASKFDYFHAVIEDRNVQIEAFENTMDMVSAINFSDYAAPLSWIYCSWETNTIITHELIKNLLLALSAILITTVILLANLLTSLYVMICVLLTMINVMALMAWWGLVIDAISCINLVISIGLCVDYSAHVGLHFMQVGGSKDKRVIKTLGEIGPAVLNGAFSTWLAFICLMFSDSHVFLSFFKITFGVFLFGIFHGLLFLPVLLSLIGPAPYNKSLSKRKAEENKDAQLDLMDKTGISSEEENKDVQLNLMEKSEMQSENA